MAELTRKLTAPVKEFRSWQQEAELSRRCCQRNKRLSLLKKKERRNGNKNNERFWEGSIEYLSYLSRRLFIIRFAVRKNRSIERFEMIERERGTSRSRSCLSVALAKRKRNGIHRMGMKEFERNGKQGAFDRRESK